MKNLLSYILILLISIFIISCDTAESDDDPNSLGGDPNLTLGGVGNTITTGSLIIGGNTYDTGSLVQITKNVGGVATIKLNMNLTQVPGLAAFNNFIPQSMKDTQGRINTELLFKVTSEGIQDNMNVDGKMHTMVKFGAKVGDEYQLQTSNGKTITRRVTGRSDNDDFPYGFMLIKTLTVEQDSRIPGVQKFVYRFNHKFGLVYAEMYLDDGSKASMYFFPTNY